VYFSHRVAGRDKAAQQIIVDLTVVPRSVVTTALAVAARVGLTPETVTIADAVQGNSGNLLPRAGRRRWPARRRLLGGALAAAVALTGAAGFFRAEQAHETARALEQDVAAAKQDADAAVRLRAEIARVGAAAQFLVNRKHKVPSVSLLLLELTRILPDEAFLTDLQLTGNDVQLAGSAASATNLIERLNHAAMFADAGFRSPVVRDPRLDRENFNISMRLVAGPAR
jgi:general secretion pathway protein L